MNISVKNNIKFTFLDDALGIYYLYNNNFSKSLFRRFCSEFIVISKHAFKLNLKNPNTVIIFDDEIAVVPFMYTGKTDEVIMSLDQVLTVVRTNEKSEEDYLKLHKDS